MTDVDGARSDEVKRALRISVVEGLLWAVMVGAGESYFGVLAVKLGHRGVELAILMTLPLLVGAVGQLFSGWFCELFGSRRRFVAAGVAVQGVSVSALAVIGAYEYRGFGPLLFCTLLYWFSGLATAPPWGSWMADLIDGPARHRYFAWRSAAINAVMVVAFVLGAEVLERSHRGPSAFAWVFGVAALARFASAVGLGLQPDPAPRRERVDWREQVASMVRTSSWGVAGYIVVLMLGVNLSSPFVVPYMIEDLQLDYRTFSWLSATTIITKALVFPGCHRLAMRMGLGGLLIASGVAIAIIPLAWGLSASISALVAAHILGGVGWAWYEFASYQLLLQSTGEQHRSMYLSVAGCFAGVAQVGGGAVGGELLDSGMLSYRGLFFASAAVRAVALIAFLGPVRRWARSVVPIQMVLRATGVRPAAGALTRPLSRPTLPPTPPDG